MSGFPSVTADGVDRLLESCDVKPTAQRLAIARVLAGADRVDARVRRRSSIAAKTGKTIAYVSGDRAGRVYLADPSVQRVYDENVSISIRRHAIGKTNLCTRCGASVTGGLESTGILACKRCDDRLRVHGPCARRNDRQNSDCSPNQSGFLLNVCALK